MNKTLVVVPTYNERENLPPLAQRLLNLPVPVNMLVVDDNSPDGTGDVADQFSRENPRVHVLHRPGKQGLATAYRAGFKWALFQDYAYVFEMDADLSHDPKYLPDFLREIATADLVLGSRYLHRRASVVNWPIARLALSYFANIYARLVTGLKVSDATGGFKCFRRRVLEAIELDQVRSNGYAFQIEMSFRAWRKGFRIVEIPIVFTDRTDGKSKMSGAIVREAVWMVWRLRIQSLLGRL